MNTLQIADLLMKNRHTRTLFKGVYPSDLLPDYIDRTQRSAYVINTDRHDKPGSHWVVVYFSGTNRCEFFDTFSRPPSAFVPEIATFIRNNSDSVIYNKRVLQNLASSACGYYCVHFVIGKARGYTLHKITSVFDTYNFFLNDRKVWRLIQT